MTEGRKQGLYTTQMRETARRNALTYDWARRTVEQVTRRADQLLSQVEAWYRLAPSEGFPRATTMSTLEAGDEVKNICPYCGIHIQRAVRDGAWIVDPIRNPWKVSCPCCHSSFPSNDFGLLYQRGLDEKGEYDRELAIRNNEKAVAMGEKDALVNESFPDKEPGWMVDDGFGWSLRDGTYGTLDVSKWAPMAYYHGKFWYSHHELDAHSYVMTLEVLKLAYLYTGKCRYSQAGILLLDKAADVYPAYDIKKVGLGYPASHGLGFNGKILGSIWEYYIAEKLITAYSAFEAVMEEPVRAKVQERIVREAFRAVKAGAIYGNFGMHQKIAALAAVALEEEQQTNEILEWLIRPSEAQNDNPSSRREYRDPIYGTSLQVRYKNDGGELIDKFIDEIDHDGFGAEIGITYNKLWFINTLDIAEILSCCTLNQLDLFQNPKFLKMFDTFIHMTAANGTSLALGDSGYTVSAVYPFAKESLRGYHRLHDPKLAQIYDFYVEGELSDASINLFTDPKELAEALKSDIETYGSYRFESDHLTGYGLTVLRHGQHRYDEEGQYDTWMYYGRTSSSHAHRDMLQLGLDAFGVNLTPDLGYPEATAFQPNRYEWVKATISHNTVVVNGESQTEQYTGSSLHYDSTDLVKLMDVDGSCAYEETEIYRRTAVTIAINDQIGYTLDFFRVKGGNHHMYSFHAQSYLGCTTEGIHWNPQVNEQGEFIGTYAGIDVPYGHDPNSTDTVRAEKTRYPRGFTWLTHVNRGTAEKGSFSIDFSITDFRNHAKDGEQIHLRYTALNRWIPDGVDLAVGYPPRKKVNEVIPGLDYLFIYRKGQMLDTLYTSLLEPYKGECSISRAEVIPVIVKSGQEQPDDSVEAVKIILEQGGIDYVIYATNNQVTYCVIDGAVSFDFRGFLGVYRTGANGEPKDIYVNDGDCLGDLSGVSSYTGTIEAFTKEFVIENELVIRLDQMLEDCSQLKERYIYIESTSRCNTVYRILDARKEGNLIRLSLGNTTLIERMADKADISKGYLYAVKEGQSFKIPMSWSFTFGTGGTEI